MSKNDKRNGAFTREEAAHTPPSRAERAPRVQFGQGGKLVLPEAYKKPGFHQHWFVDEPGELEGAEAAWYEYILDEKGNKITTPAGNGLTHYAMEIDLATYNADQKAEQERLHKATQDAAKVGTGQYSANGKGVEGVGTAVSREI